MERITDEIVRPMVVDGATLITLDGMTVGLLDNVTVPEEIQTGYAVWLLEMTTGDELEDGCCPLGFILLGDICTTKAGSAEEARVLPALTAATFAPLAIAKMPDERLATD